MVDDINPGTAGSGPDYLTNVGGTLFFNANDGTSGTELWKSDGSTAGTTLVDDINPGATGSDPGYLTNVGGTLFFAANDGTSGTELWKSVPDATSSSVSCAPSPVASGSASTCTVTVTDTDGQRPERADRLGELHLLAGHGRVLRRGSRARWRRVAGSAGVLLPGDVHARHRRRVHGHRGLRR